MGVEVTYLCGKTGKSVVSSEGLPAGWVIPTLDLSACADENKPPPPHYTVVAFSSEDAMRRPTATLSIPRATNASTSVKPEVSLNTLFMAVIRHMVCPSHAPGWIRPPVPGRLGD